MSDLEDIEAIDLATIANEEHAFWRRNTAILYDYAMEYKMEATCFSLEWLTDIFIDESDDCSYYRLLCGTDDMIKILNIQIPDKNINYDWDVASWGDGIVEEISSANPKIKIERQLSYPGAINQVSYMPQKPDIVAIISAEGGSFVTDLDQFNRKDSNPNTKLVGGEGLALCLSWNTKRSGLLLSGGENGLIYLWDVMRSERGTVTPLEMLIGHVDGVKAVSWTDFNENLFGSVGSDKMLLLWDTRVNNETPIIGVQAHNDEVSSLAFSHFSPFLLATGSADTTVAVWDIRNIKAKLYPLQYHQDQVSKVHFSTKYPDLFASSDRMGQILFWDLSQLQWGYNEEYNNRRCSIFDDPIELNFIHAGHKRGVKDFAWNMKPEDTIASVSEDSILQIWRRKNS